MKKTFNPRYKLLVDGWHWDWAFTLEEAIEKQKKKPEAVIYDTIEKITLRREHYER